MNIPKVKGRIDSNGYIEFVDNSGNVVTEVTTSGLTPGPVIISTATTTGITISAATTTGILVSGNATDGIKVSGGTLVDGIEIGSSTNGINLNGTMTVGLNGSSATIAPDASRTNSFISFGNRTAEKTINITGTAGVAYHLDPIQMNINVTCSAAPNTTSTWNGIYQNITHDTTNMSSLRLKCADWNVIVGKNVLDAYCYQGEVDFTATATVGGEAAAMGLTINASAGTITGNIWGAIIAMDGASMPAATSAGLFVSARTNITHSLYLEANSSKTVTNGIYINCAGTFTNIIKINNPTNSSYFLLANATGGCVSSTNTVGSAAGRLLLHVGATDYAILYYALS